MNLGNWTGTIEPKGSILLTTPCGVELEYTDLEISLSTYAADPSLGQPEHIEDCEVVGGKLEIYSPDGDSIFICDIEGWTKIAPEGMEVKFYKMLEELAWEYIGDYDDE